MKVLVTAASRHGATRELAQVIDEVLVERGLDVTLLPPDEVADVSEYDALVIGSAVYAGRWLPDAKAIVQRHAAVLRMKRVWLFSSGPLGEPPLPPEDPPDGVVLRETIEAAEHRVFPGRLDPAALGTGERLIVKVVRAPAGDFRPWPAVRAWAAAIASALEGNRVPREVTAGLAR